MLRRPVSSGLRFEAIGYEFLTEVLVRRPETSVIEVPYVFRPRLRGELKLSATKCCRHLSLCLKLAEHRPLKFAVVGASGVAVTEGLLYVLAALGMPIPLASPLAIEAFILNNFTWDEL